MRRHTLSPWKSKRIDDNTISINGPSLGPTSTGKCICTIVHHHWDEEAEQTAKVIELSPLMFDALLALAQARRVGSDEMRRTSYNPEVQAAFDAVEVLAEG